MLDQISSPECPTPITKRKEDDYDLQDLTSTSKKQCTKTIKQEKTKTDQAEDHFRSKTPFSYVSSFFFYFALFRTLNLGFFYVFLCLILMSGYLITSFVFMSIALNLLNQILDASYIWCHHLRKQNILIIQGNFKNVIFNIWLCN